MGLENGSILTESIFVSDCLFFRTVRQQYSKKRHHVFQNRAFQPLIRLLISFLAPEMTTFSNDTRADCFLVRPVGFTRRITGVQRTLWYRTDPEVWCRRGAWMKNRNPVFKSQTRSRSRLKTVPEKSVIDFHSGIDPRFWDQNRSANFILKSISDWKPVWAAPTQTERKIGIRFSYENRSAILRSKSDPDFGFEIG